MEISCAPGGCENTRPPGQPHVPGLAFCSRHSKLIVPPSKSIRVINPFLPNFAQCAVIISYADDCELPSPTLCGILPPLSSPVKLRLAGPSPLPPELAQPATQGNPTTRITHAIFAIDISKISSEVVNLAGRATGAGRHPLPFIFKI